MGTRRAMTLIPRLLLDTGSGGVGIALISVAIDRHGFGLAPAGLLLTLLSAFLTFGYWLGAQS